jgi:putative phosphoesterase
MAARWVRKVAAIPDGAGRIAVVADTHSQLHPATLGLLAKIRPDAILHAGDIGDLAVLSDLARIAPVHAIRGNIDSTTHDLGDVLVATQRSLRIVMVHIGVYGAKLRTEIETIAQKERANLVICGHSHVPLIASCRGIAVFNPGSCGPRRFGLPIVFGTIEVAPTGARFAHIDCETGNAWLPPA